jgi:hypothetical protein
VQLVEALGVLSGYLDQLHFECAFVVSVLTCVVDGLAILMQTFPEFCGCAPVCTCVKKCPKMLRLSLAFCTAFGAKVERG